MLVNEIVTKSGQTPALQRLLVAKKVGVVFGGGSTRCAFQIGVVETLRELSIRPALTIGVSGGVWNAAAVAAGADHRLRHYWRAFARMPRIDLRKLLTTYSPFRFVEMHERTFTRYIGRTRLHDDDALPMFVSVTRLRDRAPMLFNVRDVEDPLQLLLASNFLPPFYLKAPIIDGEKYGDGGFSDNAPYEKPFEEGCDHVILLSMKGESEGDLYRSPRDVNHRVADEYADRVTLIRPRHRLPFSFNEWNWSKLSTLIEAGRLRAREVLLGERHAATDLRAQSQAPTVRLARLSKRIRGRERG